DAEAAAIPAGANVNFIMDLATQPDFSDQIQIPVTDGAVPAADWDEYFRAKLGKSPAAKENYVRFEAYLVGNGQEVRVGTPETYFAAKTLTVTPCPLDITISEGYYLIGTINGWALDTQCPMKHSNLSVYDDPVFTIAVEISEEEAAAGWWWKVASKEAIEAANWDVINDKHLIVCGPATNGDEALEGSLVDKDAQAGCIKEAGNFILTINMIDMTYKFEKMSYLYTPGNSNGWNQAASQQLAYNADKGYYEGYAYLDGEFKFTNQPNWDGTNYGKAETEGSLSTDGGAGNLNAAEAGLYYLTVDVENLTYTMTKITSYGAIGGFNSWGAQTVMTPSADYLKWTGEVTFAAGDEWKFRANDNWDINLGGSISNLVLNGGNLVAPGAGTYTVTLDLSALPYTCTYTAK
ncbi:MAG: SusF/SusE family outer membrane protein, partial [Muribaculaceae bacterium]|nr:SusF/SusE family outer membrane protein [Muribaculaceae bacterium]